MKPFRIALCQIVPTFDKMANVDHALAMAEEAASNGAAFVTFPEMFYQPFELLRLRSIAGDEDAILRRFGALCSKHGIYCCTGSMASRREGRQYNTSHLIGPGGDVLVAYDKCHLFDADLDGVRVRESAVFAHGDHLATVAADLAAIGIVICYDIRFPELVRATALRGAELLVVPAVFSEKTGPAHWECLVRARAIENQVFVAAVSQGRSNDPAVTYKSYGHSMLVSPWGEVLAEAGNGETILYGDLDPETLTRTRRQLPLLQHRRDTLYTTFSRE